MSHVVKLLSQKQPCGCLIEWGFNSEFPRGMNVAVITPCLGGDVIIVEDERTEEIIQLSKDAVNDYHIRKRASELLSFLRGQRL